MKQFKCIRVLTGLQPTGTLHLGNYSGSLLKIIELQKTFQEIYVPIVDYHSLTTSFGHNHSLLTYNHKIGQQSLKMVKYLLGCGINAYQTKIFIQSNIPQHTQLCWILSCMCPQHWLNNMIQFKQKSNQISSIGLYIYPILMAADILLYKATHIPVGIDQLQHIQLTIKFTERFNQFFNKQFFPLPQYIPAVIPKVMSLTNPLRKMSKSELNDRSQLNLSDSPQVIRDKIRRAITDSNPNNLDYNPDDRPGLANLYRIYSIVKGIKLEEAILEIPMKCNNIPNFKLLLIEEISKTLTEINRRVQGISDEEVKRVLSQGRQKAQQVAIQTLNEVKNIMGLFNS